MRFQGLRAYLLHSLALACALSSAVAWAGALEPDIACIAKSCGLPLASCALDHSCRTSLGCVQTCTADDPDTRQTCLIGCVEATPSAQYDSLTSCIVEHSCLPKTKPRACPWPRRPNAMAPVTLSDLEGSWQVVRGLSPAYDCWPCQTMKFSQQSPSQSRYDYEYMVKAPVLSRISCSVNTMLGDTGEPILGRFKESYLAHGVVGHDDWFVLSHPHPDYALLDYCGASAMDSYQGAAVITRQPNAEVPTAVQEAFRQALKEADFSPPVTLDAFCPLDHRTCPG